jgi:6-phosphogluconate dehydrogenase
MRIGFLGLGKMGSRMAKKLIADGHDVVVWNRSKEPVQALIADVEHAKPTHKSIGIKNFGIITPAETVQELVGKLSPTRIIWAMLPAGDATESQLSEVSKYLEKNDILIDGGNANWKDTQRRFETFTKLGIRFLGIGVSGGVLAEKNGFPLMAGGDKSAYEEIVPILDTFAYPNGGHTYLGTGGAGHFVKMVHNGVEYGMMQAIGEGFEVLEKSPFNLDLLQVGQIWQRGSIVSSFLIDRAVDALKKDGKLANLAGPIAENGEAKWTLDAAKEEGVQVKVIEDSLQYRWDSQTDEKIQNSYTAKMVSALRFEFGGHEVKKK